MAAAAITACTEEMEDPALYTQTIRAVLDDGSMLTRTAVAEGKDGMEGIMWTKDDALGVFTASGSENAKFITSITSPQGEADFTGSLKDGAAAYAYYPYNSSNTGRTISGTLPLVQEYSTDVGTLAYDYKIGTPKKDVANQFTFTHIFPLLRFTVNAEGTALEDDKLVSVTITFPEDVNLNNGKFTVPVTGGSVTWTEQGVSGNEMTLKWTDKPELASGKTYFGYLACPAVEGLKDKKIKVTVTTENFQAEFFANLKIDSFKANSSYSFPLTLSKWKDLSESGFIEIDKNAPQEVPSLTALSFTAANNSGKILAKKLYYDTTRSPGGSGYKGSTYFTTLASKTTQTMTVNEEEGTITGCIPYLFDRNLVPTVTLSSEKAILQYNSGDGFVNWDGSTPIDFSAGNVIRIIQNGVSRDYVVNITNTGLPVVVINQSGGTVDWSNIGEKVVAKDPPAGTPNGTIAIYKADGTLDLAAAEGLTRLRGNTTINYPKKPFAIKLADKAEVLGMPAHKRWVLLANWKDKSLMRNHISLGIARLFSEKLGEDGIPWNVDGRFVEVVYNGVHVGNYYLCEQIKIDENRLNIKDPYDKDDAFTSTSDYGYLLEADDNFDETYKFMTKHHLPFMFKDDCDSEGKIKSYVSQKVQGIEDNLYKGYKGTASGFTDAYNDLDLPSVVDQLLIHEMTMSTEFRHPKSVYMYIDGNGKLKAGPVWDFDWVAFSTLNSGYTEESDRSYTASLMATPSLIKYGHQVSSSAPSNKDDDDRKDAPFMWYTMLIFDGTFTQMAADRWNTIKGDIASYASEIDNTYNLIKVSWEYNNAMWPACYSDNCDRQYATKYGFCGDEKLESFELVRNAFKTAYSERLKGMNDFVVNKTWPTDKWKGKF